VETNNKLRIVTWNCRDGPFEAKRALVEKLKPDILILQEIPDPGTGNDAHFIWIPSRLTKKKGLAVISAEGLDMNFDQPAPELPEMFIPVRIRGRADFNLLAVWTQAEQHYIESFEPVLPAYRDFLSEVPSVIAGDFNSNPLLDRKNRKFGHRQLVTILDRDFGLVSAYHTFHDAIPGVEPENTFYQYYHEDKPFHLDYCFVPKRWEIAGVTVGTYDDWCREITAGKNRSDHCPLIVDLNLVPGPSRENGKQPGDTGMSGRPEHPTPFWIKPHAASRK
jgi:exodeoxyribonuclease III